MPIGLAYRGHSTRKSYAKLAGDVVNVQQIIYPQDLLDYDSNNGHFVLFNFNAIEGTSFKEPTQATQNQVVSPFGGPVVYEEKSNSLRRHMKVKYKRTSDSIAINMPDSVRVGYGVQWQGSELGVAGRMIRAGQNWDKISLNDVKNAALEEAKSLGGGAIQALTPINTQDAAELFTGTISDPFVEVLFKGVTNREIPMSFVFKPKNEDESRRAREICRRFKYHMHPEFKYRDTDSSYFLHPSIVDITFMKIDSSGQGQINEWLWRISTCAITDVQIDVTGDDGYMVHHDDAPTTIKLDLTFMELEQLHKGRFVNEGRGSTF